MANSSALRRWLKPPLSIEHGATITLLVSFITGAWLAGSWNANTTLALIAALTAYESQVPLGRVLRRRKVNGPALLWVTLYGAAAVISAWILFREIDVLGRIYMVAFGALVVNLFWVLRGEQKAIANELALFLGLGLTLPFAFTATTGYIAEDLLGYWLLIALATSSSIFTVRLRLHGDEALTAAAIYHVVALSLVFMLVRLELLDALLAYAMVLPMGKLVAILLYPARYETMKLTHIGLVETALTIGVGMWIGLWA